MGMDGLNNAVLPGHATPEQYVKEITVANDGIVNQKTVLSDEACSRSVKQLNSRTSRPATGGSFLRFYRA